MHWFDDFEIRRFEVNGSHVHAHVSRGECGARPALLLLHGFPQTHVMWHRVAQRLQQDFYLIVPDLRGYGDSGKPAGLPDHSTYCKRAMAQDLVAVMDQLGITQFGLCGHDRGGRVAHRLAVDYAERVTKLCVIDIVPTLDVYAGNWGASLNGGQSPNASLLGSDSHLALGSDPLSPLPNLPRYFELAQAYYHWFHLTQPEPLPETMIGGNPMAYLHQKLGGWGTGGMAHLEPAALAEYERCFIKPETIHAVCEDYRAGASIDLVHDQASRTAGQKIACNTLVLWGAKGVVNRLFAPLTLWQAQCTGMVTGQTLATGHFIPEELPQETANLLRGFFSP
jgi:haloacetate dehalogenase